MPSNGLTADGRPGPGRLPAPARAAGARPVQQPPRRRRGPRPVPLPARGPADPARPRAQPHPPLGGRVAGPVPVPAARPPPVLARQPVPSDPATVSGLRFRFADRVIITERLSPVWWRLVRPPPGADGAKPLRAPFDRHNRYSRYHPTGGPRNRRPDCALTLSPGRRSPRYRPPQPIHGDPAMTRRTRLSVDSSRSPRHPERVRRPRCPPDRRRPDRTWSAAKLAVNARPRSFPTSGRSSARTAR